MKTPRALQDAACWLCRLPLARRLPLVFLRVEEDQWDSASFITGSSIKMGLVSLHESELKSEEERTNMHTHESRSTAERCVLQSDQQLCISLDWLRGAD